jgi:arylsulfatase A-like enzyme
VHGEHVRPLTDAPRARVDAAAWLASLALVLLAAKVAVVVLRFVDGAGVPRATAWLAPALVHEDLRLVVGFGAAVALAAAARRVAPRAAPAALTALYGALAFWAAFNVPVTRLLASPLTFAMLHATGGAISDSIARYLTPLNLGLPLALWLGALALPRALAGRLPVGPRPVGAAVSVAALVLALGPTAVARAELSGWHRDAALALLETAAARGAGARPPSPPPLEDPRCRPLDDPGARDLSDLAGVARGRNVVWVVLESTGARFLPAYGAARDVTPRLSALAARAPSVIFDAAYAAYPESIKGLFSMLCAREPPPGAEASDFGAGREPCAAAPAALARAGYRTGLFHSGWFAYLGMDAVVNGRGFEALVDAGGVDSPHRSSFGVDDRATARRLLAWIDAGPRARPFFAAFMPIAGHHPYHAPGDAPRPWPERDDASAYLNDLAVADDAFGVLRDGLRARGLDERTVYVVVGDHGEAFREHAGNVAHALYVYEENVRVPFIVAAPGASFASRRAPQLASLVDLLPTTLALAGAPPEPAHAGRSLLSPVAPRVARFSTEQSVRRRGLRDGRWKTILDGDAGRAALYDLATDPAERVDRAAERPDIVARHRACL